MSKSVTLNWEKLLDSRSLDSSIDFLRENGGLYIWIFKGKPRRVTYVGEASKFVERFTTHFSNILTGRYNTYKMDEGDDFVEHLHIHYHGKSLKEIKEQRQCYIPTQPSNSDFSFEETFFDKDLLEMHRNYLSQLLFAFATSKEFEDTKIRRQVEGILIEGLRNLYAKYAGVELLRSSESRSYNIPIGNISLNPKESFSLHHEGGELQKIPEDILKIAGYDLKKKEVRLSE